MKNKFAIVVLIITAGVWSFFFIRSKPNSIVLDGEKYEFVIYDIKSNPIRFLRSDKSPEAVLKYPWVAAASMSYGGAFLSGMTDQQLSDCYENPPQEIRMKANKFLKSGNLDGEISFECLEKYKIGNEWYLYVGLKRSDFPDGVLYGELVRSKNKWVVGDGSRDRNGLIVKEIEKIHKEIHKNKQRYKSVSINRL